MTGFIHTIILKDIPKRIVYPIFIILLILSSTAAPVQAVNKNRNPDLSRLNTATSSISGKWDDSFGDPGTDDVVRKFLLDEDGNLVATGGFTSIDGVSANRIALWNGSNWTSLGSGLNNGGFALAEDWNGNIYVGGNFTTAGGVSVNRIAKWDGSSWFQLGSGIEGDVVRALAFDFNGNLYAAGRFTSAGGVPVNNIAKWNGSTWSSLDSGVSGFFNIIYALTVDGNDIYAAGSFNKAGLVNANNIAKWNGTHWNRLGDGTDSGIYALEMVEGKLIAAGTFISAGGVTTNYIAMWDGNNWSSLGDGMNDHVISLAYDGDYLYAGGIFTKAGGMNTSKIAAWDGASWFSLDSGTDGPVSSLLTNSKSELFVGGFFSKAGGITSSHIARWNKDLIYVPLVLQNPGSSPPVSNPPPAPPSDLYAHPLDVAVIALQWVDNSDNEIEFIIEKSPDGVTFSHYSSTGGPDIDEIWIGGLGMGTTHCYRVFARGTHGDSPTTDIACATTYTTGPPSPLSNLTAQVISSDRILLTWTNNSSCDGYKVYESVDGGPHNYVGDVPQGNLPGAYVEDLPMGNTFSYRVVPFNSYGDSLFADSPISNTVDPPNVISNTLTKFINNTVYPVISLQIDGTEYFPTQPMGIPPGSGNYFQKELTAGSHSYWAATGFWSGGIRTEMYIYQGTFTQQNGVTGQIPFNDPTIAQILTRFSSSGYYTGDYWTGTFPNSAAFRFNNDGSYTFYRDGVAQGTGNFSMYEYTGNFMLKFQVTGNQNAIATMDERSSSFYMSNGPTDWPTIQYTYDGY